MNGNEVITVLKEIRDEVREVRDETRQVGDETRQVHEEVRQTNVRLDQTNARLDETNARLDETNVRLNSLEHRVADGFAEVGETLQLHSERWDDVVRHQAESEMRLATEVVALAAVTHQVRDLIDQKLDDHKMVIDHEQRLKAIEDASHHP
jgi:methyl-accepting chemotaxis protein